LGPREAAGAEKKNEGEQIEQFVILHRFLISRTLADPPNFQTGC